MQFVLPKQTLRLLYLNLHRGLSELPYRHDPTGLAVTGAPKDEYESKVGNHHSTTQGCNWP
jgi:hypothetical protein